MTDTLMEKIENLDTLDDPFEFDLQDMVEYAPAPFVAPETVRFNQDQKAIVPFTSSSARIPLHYIDDEDCRGYVHCNGEDDCIACKAGRKVVERILLPVYLPVEIAETIAVHFKVFPEGRRAFRNARWLQAFRKS